MSQRHLKCRIPSLSEDDLMIILGEPVKEAEEEYSCTIQISPLDSQPMKIFGVDATQATDLARRTASMRLQGMAIYDLDHKLLDQELCDLI